MTAGDGCPPGRGDRGPRPASRRGLFAAAAGGLAAALGPAASAAPGASHAAAAAPETEPFFGLHQGGIATAQQRYTYFAAFDLLATKRADLAAMMRGWTDAAARMARGETARPLGADGPAPPADSGEALDLPPARLTVTFGFGPGLFLKDGQDRYGLAARRPAALIELPRFNGDQLQAERSGGDLSVQACADDPQVAFHAVRQLARLAYGAASIRWAQSGFLPARADGGTPRNLIGFKDGTQQPGDLDASVWVGAEGPEWMRGGSYLVARRIRIALEHWDRTDMDFQEAVIGRHKRSGAPLGSRSEFDPLRLDAVDADGNPVIAENAHVRLAAAASHGGAQILRRAYAYNDGVGFTAERWPPWRQGIAYDAGLFFLCYQRDPRSGFVRIFETMAKFDALNQFVTHTASGLFACPRAAQADGFVGEDLLSGG